MNLICPKCGEAWDFDMLHERVDELKHTWGHTGTTYKDVARDFRARGCEALGESHSVAHDAADRKAMAERTAIAEAAYEVMGEDMDGAASEFDDWGM